MPEVPTSNSALDHALDLWRRGLSVFPVPRPRPGAPAGQAGDGKVPTLAWREFQNRRPTEDEIRAWFSAPRNIAVITGQVSDVVVIDADSPKAVHWVRTHLPRTPWQTKTARGYHLWYRRPGIRVANRARVETRDGRLALDVRGDGGYVIGPSSIHQTGARYEYAGDWSVPREQLPLFWVGWVACPARPLVAPQPSSGPRPTVDIIERARRYLAAVPCPEIGHGSDAATLSAACRLTRGFGLSESDATVLLREWTGGRAGWTHEWITRKVRNAIAYGTEPMGVLR